MKPNYAELWFAGVLLLSAAGCASNRPRDVAFHLGNTTIHAMVLQHSPASPTMINVHDDENTSVIAGKEVLGQTGGRLIELSHSGQRLVSFESGGMTYRFDPNRIFSDSGIRDTLTRRGVYSEEAHQEVNAFAAALLKRFNLDCEPVIIALHNTDGKGLTIQSYLPTNELSSASVSVHVSGRCAPGDFFYVTDQRFFDYLKARDFNVTLQDDAHVPDDGSLSVYFARRGIPYVNVEADIHHLHEQVEMVRTVVQMTREFGLAPPTR